MRVRSVSALCLILFMLKNNVIDQFGQNIVIYRLGTGTGVYTYLSENDIYSPPPPFELHIFIFFPTCDIAREVKFDS
jgi:hypothetical protein